MFASGRPVLGPPPMHSDLFLLDADSVAAKPTQPMLAADSDEMPSERNFVAMQALYRSSGGIACGDDLARLLEDHRCGDFVSLQRLLSSHEIFGFEWRGTVWDRCSSSNSVTSPPKRDHAG